jgi:hypothetical protein
LGRLGAAVSRFGIENNDLVRLNVLLLKG